MNGFARQLGDPRRALCITIGLALIVALPSFASAKKSKAPSTGLRGVEYDRPAPNFCLNERSECLSDLAGKVVVIHFWATWCEPCQKELPFFSQLRSSFGDVVILTLPWHDDLDSARNYVKVHELNLPVAGDPEGAAAKAYSIQAIPATIIVRPNGTVGYVSVGAASWDELSTALGTVAGVPHVDPSPTL